MTGTKLKWSKRAIRKIIKHLKPSDRLHFITYDSSAKIVFENGDLKNKDELVKKVNGVQAGDFTNIEVGLNEAFSILKKETGEKKNYMKRIFLFSDGVANQGIQTKEGLFGLIENYVKHDITTSSFGIGKDFNEDTMSGIAKSGRGRYFFLDHDENITKQVSKAIHGLLGQIGSNCELSMRGIKGVSSVEKIYGRDSLHKFIIGDLFSSNTKNIIMKMNVKSPDKSTSNGEGEEEEEGEEEDVIVEDEKTDDGSFLILQYDLKYESTEPQDYVEISGEVRLSNNNNKDIVMVDQQKVRTSLAIKQAAEKNGIVTQLIQSEKLDEAIEVMKEIVSELHPFHKEDPKVTKIMENNRAELKKMEERRSQGKVNAKLMQDIIKNVDYYGYQCNEDSAAEFNSGCDSDEWNSADEVTILSPNLIAAPISPNLLNDNSPTNSFDSDDSFSDKRCLSACAPMGGGGKNSFGGSGFGSDEEFITLGNLKNRNNDDGQSGGWLKELVFQDIDQDSEVVSVIITMFEGSSFDNLFRRVSQKVPFGRVALYYLRKDGFPKLLEMMKDLPIKKRIGVVSDEDEEDEGEIEDLKKGKEEGKEEEKEDQVEKKKRGRPVVMEAEPQKLIDELMRQDPDRGFYSKSTMEFVELLMKRGHTVMFSDFAVKALVSEWDKMSKDNEEFSLGPNPFVKVGECGSSIVLNFDSKDLVESGIPQLEAVGKLCVRGDCKLKCLGGTVVVGINWKNVDCVDPKYSLKVYTVASELDKQPAKSKYASKTQYFVQRGEAFEEEEEEKKKKIVEGTVGHAVLTFHENYGLIIVSAGHWIELKRLETSVERVEQWANENYGVEYENDLLFLKNENVSQVEKKKKLKEMAKKFVQQMPSVKNKRKKKTKYAFDKK